MKLRHLNRVAGLLQHFGSARLDRQLVELQAGCACNSFRKSDCASSSTRSPHRQTDAQHSSSRLPLIGKLAGKLNQAIRVFLFKEANRNFVRHTSSVHVYGSEEPSSWWPITALIRSSILLRANQQTLQTSPTMSIATGKKISQAVSPLYCSMFRGRGHRTMIAVTSPAAPA